MGKRRQQINDWTAKRQNLNKNYENSINQVSIDLDALVFDGIKSSLGFIECVRLETAGRRFSNVSGQDHQKALWRISLKCSEVPNMKRLNYNDQYFSIDYHKEVEVAKVPYKEAAFLSLFSRLRHVRQLNLVWPFYYQDKPANFDTDLAVRVLRSEDVKVQVKKIKLQAVHEYLPLISHFSANLTSVHVAFEALFEEEHNVKALESLDKMLQLLTKCPKLRKLTFATSEWTEASGDIVQQHLKEMQPATFEWISGLWRMEVYAENATANWLLETIRHNRNLVKLAMRGSWWEELSDMQKNREMLQIISGLKWLKIGDDYYPNGDDGEFEKQRTALRNILGALPSDSRLIVYLTIEDLEQEFGW